ncbi:MAG TPA: hypothetical protein VE968_04480 [Sphingomicrobium sp.]|nr:hypothetical protein [Sphingomicrobium sp.]
MMKMKHRLNSVALVEPRHSTATAFFQDAVSAHAPGTAMTIAASGAANARSAVRNIDPLYSAMT